MSALVHPLLALHLHGLDNGDVLWFEGVESRQGCLQCWNGLLEVILALVLDGL